MLVNFFILLFTALLAGISAFFLPNMERFKYRLTLVFAGAYLFSVTIVHILPELFAHASDPRMIGAFILVGFFMQQGLEYFTSGVEHGHVHLSDKGEHHGRMSSFMILFAMCIHSFLEGSLLAHPSSIHAHHDANALLFGILMHKAPAAFALVSILKFKIKNKQKVIAYLLLFALASPMGLLLGDIMVGAEKLSESVFTVLFALVCGNFLHISTTIVFESSADHHFNLQKFFVALIGAIVAVAAEFFI